MPHNFSARDVNCYVQKRGDKHAPVWVIVSFYADKLCVRDAGGNVFFANPNKVTRVRKVQYWEP